MSLASILALINWNDIARHISTIVWNFIPIGQYYLGQLSVNWMVILKISYDSYTKWRFVCLPESNGVDIRNIVYCIESREPLTHEIVWRMLKTANRTNFSPKTANRFNFPKKTANRPKQFTEKRLVIFRIFSSVFNFRNTSRTICCF